MINNKNAYIAQLHAARNPQAIAALLLTVPDIILARYLAVFNQYCDQHGFVGGKGYIAARLAVRDAPRDANGLLPEDVTLDAEEWRVAVLAFASGEVADD